MLITPRQKLKVYQFATKVNMVLTILNLGCIGIMLLCEEQIPIESLLTAALNAACWFLCATGIDVTKKVYGLDDKGNFSFRNMEDKDERN